MAYYYLFPFPVPAVVQNPTALGTQAGEMMLKRLRGSIKNPAPKIVMLDTELIFSRVEPDGYPPAPLTIPDVPN